MSQLSRLLLLIALMVPSGLLASDAEKPVARDYTLVRAPAAPAGQTADQAKAKSVGCVSCHTKTDAYSMHRSEAVVLGCTDCHGGNATVSAPDNAKEGDKAYTTALSKAHVMPRFPKAWNWPSSANPKQSYTLLNKESREFVRFNNPSDYRVVRDSCGACHMSVIEATDRSLMSTGAMLWGGAAYNNGIAPFKNYIFGEAYTEKSEPAKILSPGITPGTVTKEQEARGALAALYPLPTWQVMPPADIFRVFERGGRTNGTQFPEVGLPNPTGQLQRLEEPGRPDIRQSNRGPGTGLRVAIPVLNIHKTRLNDPFTWFMGTNDQPGDYRHSGCSSCHVPYANSREAPQSLTYAKFGNDGQTVTLDPTIAGKMEGQKRATLKDGHGDGHGDVHGHGKKKSGHGDEHGDEHGKSHAPDPRKESGHPLEHAFTRAIPTAQCMNCHMHQPNIFLNSFLGYTMWDYESDAPLMWPEKQKYPTAAETLEVLNRNPEGAAPRGKWSDVDFVRRVAEDINPKAKETQFADYHGHGWNFRAIFKRDREGNLLDADDKVVAYDDPEKFRKKGEGTFPPIGTNPGKSVHLMDIHAEKGMQCVDCHFSQDSHGNGLIYGEVANAIEIGCKDCHGTSKADPTLLTSGPAAPPGGNNLSLIRNPDGQRRFEWKEDDNGKRYLVQRSVLDPKLEWRMSLVKDSVDPDSPNFNLKAARSKLMGKAGSETGKFEFGAGIPDDQLAHKESEMACFTCHLSWTTSCGGCHLPIEANWKTTSHKYEGEETRNFATYNPQVARDDMFQLGRHQTTKGNIITPVRSTSALILSSSNVNRERIYVQQPPISAVGFSSQAFAPHFPHTVRTTETKKCSDCHVSVDNDNNAIMAQLLLQGTNFVNFVGMYAWTGLENGVEAVRVTEYDEPQAVFGSYLQKYAYPDFYKAHVDRNKRELINWKRGKTFDKRLSGETGMKEDIRNEIKGTDDAVRCLQMRGEYLYVAEGRAGFRAYDIASVANKGVSERILTGPFSPLGHDTQVKSTNATCMALATNQPINPAKNTPEMRSMNQEQPFHPIYNYAFVTDSVEGLILVDIGTLADGEPRNNFLRRALTWNEGNILKGATHITLGGHYAYVAADAGLVVLDLNDPLKPRVMQVLPAKGPRASALQFRYLWVTDEDGVKLFDITNARKIVPVPEATVPLNNARRIYIARTYAYVAAKEDGLVILNVTNPEKPTIYQKVTFGGLLNDAEDVIVGSTNASLFAYVADGRNGMKVLQLTSPASQPNYYGFSPAPKPELIAWAKTPSPALAMSKGLDRDRGVDETGGQMAVFGRLGSRPFNREEMERFYRNRGGFLYRVNDKPTFADWVPKKK